MGVFVGVNIRSHTPSERTGRGVQGARRPPEAVLIAVLRIVATKALASLRLILAQADSERIRSTA